MEVTRFDHACQMIYPFFDKGHFDLARPRLKEPAAVIPPSPNTKAWMINTTDTGQNCCPRPQENGNNTGSYGMACGSSWNRDVKHHE